MSVGPGRRPRIAVVGSSDLAHTLLHRLRIAGYDAVLADPDDPVVASADVVILAIPFERHRELRPSLFAGKIVVDATDYFPGRGGPVRELDEGRMTSSELLARHLPDATVVKTLNTVDLLTFGAVGPLASDVTPVAMPIAADDPGAKELVAEILVDLGFQPVDAGTLRDSWRMQPGMPVHGLASPDPRTIRIALDLS